MAISLTPEAKALAEHSIVNRRQFLHSSVISAGCFLAERSGSLAGETLARSRFLAVLPFQQEGSAQVDAPIGTELDQRFYTDLSRISARRPLTPTGEFFVRSGASELLPPPARWTISVDGLVDRPTLLRVEALQRGAKPMGVHLMECAGNVRITHFGLISVASWTGVPIADLLKAAGIRAGGSQVHVSGFDHYAQPSMTSVPGAEWIFPLDALKAAGAFLATSMNGAPLTRDHGAPVRLVVPGWYGCACIKWVQSITVVDDTVESTSQMREYAVRTLQEGVPELARDFEPATIDHAAMPVRVEKWSTAGKLRYRVTGILWGGTEPVKKLVIRFTPDEAFVPIEGFHADPHAPWTVWEHLWSPPPPGMYTIQLAVADPQVRARKMDAGYYARFVEIQ